MDFTDIIRKKGDELSIEDLKLLPNDVKYIIFNPLINYYRVDTIGKSDVTHRKHRLLNLKYYKYKESDINENI